MLCLALCYVCSVHQHSLKQLCLFCRLMVRLIYAATQGSLVGARLMRHSRCKLCADLDPNLRRSAKLSCRANHMSTLSYASTPGDRHQSSSGELFCVSNFAALHPKPQRNSARERVLRHLLETNRLALLPFWSLLERPHLSVAAQRATKRIQKQRQQRVLLSRAERPKTF